VLRAVPGLTTAFFSILGPGKHLPPHHGPYRGVLRHHLAVIIPEPASSCGIRVGSQVRHWQQGRSLVFDDTYEHEAWNDTDTDTDRVVLFLDITRPLRPPMNWINQTIIRAVARSPFVRAARAQHVQREPQFAVRDDIGNAIASTTGLERTAPGPMTVLRRDGDQVHLQDRWPGEDDLGRLVLLLGGEAGILTAWWHAEDHSGWRWSVEFSNHR